MTTQGPGPTVVVICILRTATMLIACVITKTIPA